MHALFRFKYLPAINCSPAPHCNDLIRPFKPTTGNVFHASDVEGGLEVLEFLLATTLKAELPFCDVEEDGFLFWEGEDDLDNSPVKKINVER